LGNRLFQDAAGLVAVSTGHRAFKFQNCLGSDRDRIDGSLAPAKEAVGFLEIVPLTQ
jgi:hypothetical protein